jgi:hypothetical protein
LDCIKCKDAAHQRELFQELTDNLLNDNILEDPGKDGRTSPCDPQLTTVSENGQPSSELFLII